MQIEKERIEKSKIEEAKAEKEKRDKVRSLNDSFIYTNLKLMNDKKRKENVRDFINMNFKIKYSLLRAKE